MRNVRETTSIGRIVWHDLLTPDVALANKFYSELFGWDYRIEHATDFAWGPGEADYPLILAGGEAQGGFIESYANRWLAYVNCSDVDDVTARARELGAQIDREPFDVPGVGRAAVVRDPAGAAICPFVAGHNFPAPGGTFLPEILIVPDPDAARSFYTRLFGWTAATPGSGEGMPLYDADGEHVASIVEREGTVPLPGTGGIWAPYMRVRELEPVLGRAQRLGAEVLVQIPGDHGSALVADPTGAVFGLRCVTNAGRV